jgi:hypothetical protein
VPQGIPLILMTNTHQRKRTYARTMWLVETLGIVDDSDQSVLRSVLASVADKMVADLQGSRVAQHRESKGGSVHSSIPDEEDDRIVPAECVIRERG